MTALVAAVVGVAAGVPVARARAVAVMQAVTELATVVEAAFTVGATLVATPETLLLAALMVGAALVAALATLLLAAFTVGATLVASPATLLLAALTVGARLVARPVMLLAAELTVGPTRVARPAALLPAAFAVGAMLVAAPVTCVAALLVVAVALALLHAARSGRMPSMSAQKTMPFSREPIIAISFIIAAVPTIHADIRMTDAKSLFVLHRDECEAAYPARIPTTCGRKHMAIALFRDGHVLSVRSIEAWRASPRGDGASLLCLCEERGQCGLFGHCVVDGEHKNQQFVHARRLDRCQPCPHGVCIAHDDQVIEQGIGEHIVRADRETRIGEHAR